MGIFNRIFGNSKKAKELSTLNKSLSNISNICPHCGEKGFISEVNERLWCEWCASWIDRENNVATNAGLPSKNQTALSKLTPPTEMPIETESTQTGNYQTSCLNCHTKMDPIEDWGWGMQGGQITCPSCGEVHSYSIFSDYVSMNRISVPRGWIGPVEMKWPRVQREKSISENFAIADDLFNNYKWPEAIGYYDKIITKDPLNAMALHKRARCYYAWNHNFANALRDINSALQIDRLNPTYWYFRAYFYFNEEKHSRAIHDLSNALELNPNKSNLFPNLLDIYELRGRSNFVLKQYEKALADIQQCQQIKPNFDSFIEQIKSKLPH